MASKLIIISAPSGSGKSTILRYLLERFPQLEFSISATSRQPRGAEKNGVEYHFLSTEEFEKSIKNDEFVEWEEVYAGTYYGTLNSELKRIWNKGNIIVFDVDVKGGLRIKEKFGDDALAVFIMPPSIEVLRERLLSRNTDSIEVIEKRLARAELELTYANSFDTRIINDNLEVAVNEAIHTIGEFIK